jgi:drug/metabolite transporter (DMT)-like permease
MSTKGASNNIAAEANVILAVESVFATILGRVLLEVTDWRDKLGGGLILIATFIAAKKPYASMWKRSTGTASSEYL